MYPNTTSDAQTKTRGAAGPGKKANNMHKTHNSFYDAVLPITLAAAARVCGFANQRAPPPL